MDSRVQQEVIGAYNRRGKGLDTGVFVDRTRNGHYLEIDKTTGYVRQISQEEYRSSGHPRYEDGLPMEDSDAGTSSDGDSDDDSETCPDCGYSPCKSAHGVDCP